MDSDRQLVTGVTLVCCTATCPLPMWYGLLASATPTFYNWNRILCNISIGNLFRALYLKQF